MFQLSKQWQLLELIWQYKQWLFILFLQSTLKHNCITNHLITIYVCQLEPFYLCQLVLRNYKLPYHSLMAKRQVREAGKHLFVFSLHSFFAVKLSNFMFWTNSLWHIIHSIQLKPPFYNNYNMQCFVHFM